MVTDDHNVDYYELQTKKENGQIEITESKLINSICVNRFIFEELIKGKKVHRIYSDISICIYKYNHKCISII